MRRRKNEVDNPPREHPALFQEHSVVSMFSGCGGMDLGFLGGFDFLGRYYERLPFRIVWANDINPVACETYRNNLAKGHIRCADVWEVLDTMPKNADVIIGGFPCQDISINGKRRGVEGERSGQYRAMVQAVERIRPVLFIAENVKGLLMQYNRKVLRQIVSDFEGVGYDVSCDLYLAADYGVPQMRERVFIVGILKGSGLKPFRVPPPTCAEGDWITAKVAIGDLEDAAESPDNSHIWSRAKRSPDQGNRILKADRPADTIRAEHHGNIQFHYSLPRRLSMREAARLQSFPDSFRFAGKLRQTERQVGNAVPPVLAWHIAGAVRDCLCAEIPIRKIVG